MLTGKKKKKVVEYKCKLQGRKFRRRWWFHPVRCSILSRDWHAPAFIHPDRGPMWESRSQTPSVVGHFNNASRLKHREAAGMERERRATRGAPDQYPEGKAALERAFEKALKRSGRRFPFEIILGLAWRGGLLSRARPRRLRPHMT